LGSLSSVPAWPDAGTFSIFRVALGHPNSFGVRGLRHPDRSQLRPVVPAFAVPHLDNRIVVTRDGSTEEQTLGDQTSYTYQLAALAGTLQTGAEFLIDVDDSVANAELIDEVYRRPELSPRGQGRRLLRRARLTRLTARHGAVHPTPGSASRYQHRP
jgi:hypothetical protein